jgi:hypothetical protein
LAHPSAVRAEGQFGGRFGPGALRNATNGARARRPPLPVVSISEPFLALKAAVESGVSDPPRSPRIRSVSVPCIYLW